MLSDRDQNQASLQDIPHEVIVGHLAYYLPFNDQVSLFSVSNHFHLFSNTKSIPYLMHKLLSAVIDDEFDVVRQLLDLHADQLLAADYTATSMSLIRSKYSKQCFKSEHPLRLAARRYQCEMVKLLLEYMDETIYVDEIHLSLRYFLEQQKAIFGLTAKERKKKYNQLFYPLLLKTILMDEYASLEESDYLAKRYESFRTMLLTQTFSDLTNCQSQNEVVWYSSENLLLAAIDFVNTEREKYEWSLVRTQFNFYCINVIGFLQKLLPPSIKAQLIQGSSGSFQFSTNEKNIIPVCIDTSNARQYAKLGVSYFIASNGRFEDRAEKSGFEADTVRELFKLRAKIIQQTFQRHIMHADPDPEHPPELPRFTCQIS